MRVGLQRNVKAMNHRMITAAMVLALAACQQEEVAPALEGLPTGSVQTGPNMYMVPTGQPDGDGCQAYRAHSPGNLVVQMVYYSTADGGFTPNKEEAACMKAATDS
jgi:hypothetical protein